MATLKDLQDEVTRLTQANIDLTQAVNDEHTQVAGALDNLNLTIEDLKKQIEVLQQGGTIDQTTIDALKAQVDAVVAAKDQVAGIFTP